MISIDLSKAPALRVLVYLLSLIPGLFFLLSVAIGNPDLAKATLKHVQEIYPASSYALLALLIGAAFVIGQAFVSASWIVEQIFSYLYRLPMIIFRKMFGGNRAYKWFAKIQGVPPKNNFFIRRLSKLISAARGGVIDSEDAKAVRHCLTVATEELLQRRYGIDPIRATGPNGPEWQVWSSVLGVSLRPVIDSLNAARAMLACGLAGLISITLAPRLENRYYVSLTAIFGFCGLWTAGYFFLRGRNPVGRNILRLQSVLAEMKEPER